MVYQTTWNPEKPEACRVRAEQRALRDNGSLGVDVTFLYRLTETTYSCIQPYADPITDDGEWYSRTDIEIQAFVVRKKTHTGWTIHTDDPRGWRFVSSETTKKFALPTVELALESYIARKTKQAQIYRARADKADRLIEQAKGLNLLPVV